MRRRVPIRFGEKMLLFILQLLTLTGNPQYPEAFFDKILDTINKIYPGLISMLQGFQKGIA